MSELLLLCDHDLDPRLERRVSWLNEIFDRSVVITDSSRSVHGERQLVEGIRYLPYATAEEQLESFNGSLLYMCGNRILKDHFGTILKASGRHPVIWEIADLPLRAGFPKDTVIGAVFRQYLSRIAPYFVVTAPGFTRWLPARKPWLMSENVPDLDLAHQLREMRPIHIEGGRALKIGFPGNIRYFEPLVMLYRFMQESPEPIELHIWGGSQAAWEQLAERFRQVSNSTEPENVHFHGPYTLIRDAVGIYGELDFVWSVYDARQVNVRVALPKPTVRIRSCGALDLCCGRDRVAGARGRTWGWTWHFPVIQATTMPSAKRCTSAWKSCENKRFPIGHERKL